MFSGEFKPVKCSLLTNSTYDVTISLTSGRHLYIIIIFKGFGWCVSDGETNVVFVEPGVKVNSEYYCDHVLRQGLLPDIQARCSRHNWTLQQDGAPSHTARNTINVLHRENFTFIKPDMWSPNSSDLNPADYAILGALQKSLPSW